MPPDGDENGALPANLRFLKTLVTVLTAVMIFGVLTIVALLVIRLNADPAPMLVAPGDYALPPGVGIVGFSVIDGQSVIIGDDRMIRVFDAASRALVQELRIGE